MKLTANFDGEEREIDVQSEGEGCYTIVLDGKTYKVDARRMEGITWSLLIDGRSFEADIAQGTVDRDHLTVTLSGQDYPMVLLDERRKRMQQAVGETDVEGQVTIRSPMPGKLVKILVSEGEDIEAHQGVAVVEAMKMENELRSPKAGRVVQLPVAEGRLVEGGAVLAVIE